MRYLLSINLFILLVVLGCAVTDTVNDVTFTQSRPVKEVVIDNLKSPWSIAFLNDQEALISEKEGVLLRVNLVSKQKTKIEGFPSDLANPSNGREVSGGNNGIFDVVLHPNFEVNQLIYVAYSCVKPRGYTTKVISAKLAGYKLESLATIFVAESDPFPKTEKYHFGGGLLFGSDGKLYITIGERLFSEEHQPNFPIAQNLSDPRGKIYRLNPDGSIPADNPDFGANAVSGLYAVGIRAAQGLAMHPKTGEIWFSEHGTYQGDEINRLVAGANYGWPVKTTGKYRYDSYQPPTMDGTDFTDPEWYWKHTVAPTGLVFYQGAEFPEWQGDLIVPGLSRGSLWRINFEGEVIVSVTELFVNDRARSRKVRQSPNGNLYMLTEINPGKYEDSSGQLIRIVNDVVSQSGD